jgi:hypothetical protein
MLRFLCRIGEAGASFGKDHFGVRRMYLLIERAMKNNGANATIRALEMTLPSRWRLHRRGRTRGAAHGGKCRNQVGGGPIGKAGVDACRGVKFWIGGAHDRGHRAAG